MGPSEVADGCNQWIPETLFNGSYVQLVLEAPVRESILLSARKW